MTPEQILAIGEVVKDIIIYGLGGLAVLIMIYFMFRQDPPRR